MPDPFLEEPAAHWNEHVTEYVMSSGGHYVAIYQTFQDIQKNLIENPGENLKA